MQTQECITKTEMTNGSHIYLFQLINFLALLGLCCCMNFSLIVASRFLIAEASVVLEHKL